MAKSAPAAVAAHEGCLAARAATAATLLCLALASLGAPVAAWAAEPAEDEEVEPGFFTLWPEWGAAVVHTGWAAVVPELPIKALLNWHPPAAAGSAVTSLRSYCAACGSRLSRSTDGRPSAAAP